MARPSKQKQTEPDSHTKERLLRAAATVFAKKGFGGATVKEIADLAEANVSLISYHFQGKEGIFRACLEKFGTDRLRDAEMILTVPDSVEDLRAKLRLWILQIFRCHLENDDTCQILHRENITEHKFMWEVFTETFLKSFEAIIHFFQAAKKKGLVRKDIDPLVASGLLFGAVMQFSRNRDIQKKWLGTSIAEEKYRSDVADKFVSLLLHGII